MPNGNCRQVRIWASATHWNSKREFDFSPRHFSLFLLPTCFAEAAHSRGPVGHPAERLPLSHCRGLLLNPLVVTKIASGSAYHSLTCTHTYFCVPCSALGSFFFKKKTTTSLFASSPPSPSDSSNNEVKLTCHLNGCYRASAVCSAPRSLWKRSLAAACSACFWVWMIS